MAEGDDEFRLPDALNSWDEARIAKARATPRSELARLLTTESFLWNLPRAIMLVRGGKSTHLHWHIPKTAGTDLGTQLSGRVDLVNTTQLVLLARSDPYRGAMAILDALEVARGAEDLLLSGHFDLSRVLDLSHEQAIRITTVVRDPYERLRSHVDHDLRAAVLKGAPIPSRLSHLRSPEMKFAANFMTAGLVGHGIPNTEAGWSAWDALAQLNIEVVDFRRYGEWFVSTFGTTSQHKNQAPTDIALPSWSGEELAAAARSIQGDATVYRNLRMSWESSGKSSIAGEELKGLILEFGNP